MGKQLGKNVGGSYLPAAMFGTIGAMLFFGLLFLAAILGESNPIILAHDAWTAKICLFFSALICGSFAGKRAGQRKLLHALTAEGVVLAVLVLCVLCRGNDDICFTSVLIDLLLLLFGAFAGTWQRKRGRIKRRGKR